MLDYIFFNENLLGRYLDYLKEHGIRFEQRNDEMGMVVSIPEDLPEETEEGADDYYEELLASQETLLEEDGESQHHSIAAITVNLSDGRTVYAPVRPDLLNRLLESISAQELGEIVDAIVNSVENPDETPICKR